MKLSCLQENLNKGLTIVSHIASRNTTLPILNNVLVEAIKGALKLTSTNLEIGINSTVRGKIEEEGKIAIPAQLFASYVNSLPNKQVNLNLEKDVLGIKCENQKTKIKGFDASDFPIIPKIERNEGYICKRDELKIALQQTVFTIIPNETRPEISGALLVFTSEQGKNKLYIVGTDSYRLAEKTVEFKALGNNKIQTPSQMIVPQTSLLEAIRILDQEEAEEVNIYMTENQVLFVCGATEMVSRLISGKYPDYKQIVPESFKTTAVFDVKDLTQAVKSASLFAQTGVNDVSLKVTPDGKIAVSSVNTQTGENTTILKAEVEGEGNEIVFNYRYLLDGLNNLKTQEASLKVVDSKSRPGLLKPVDDESYFYIIMPIIQ